MSGYAQMVVYGVLVLVLVLVLDVHKWWYMEYKSLADEEKEEEECLLCQRVRDHPPPTCLLLGGSFTSSIISSVCISLTPFNRFPSFHFSKWKWPFTHSRFGHFKPPLVLFSVFDINDIKPLVFLFCIWGIYQFVISLVCKLSNSSWNRT